jgi:hypothetical protein
VDLDPQRLDVVCPVRAAGEVAQVELDLVPPLVQPHGHGADEGLNPSRGLHKMGCSNALGRGVGGVGWVRLENRAAA